jgi:hypothetical protein
LLSNMVSNMHHAEDCNLFLFYNFKEGLISGFW